MNKILTSLIAISFAMPAMAEITTGATCDTTNLGQSENNSTANVEADWTANTININWWDDEDAMLAYASTTCTYDGTITLPQEPTKTGYTFNGWQLRAAVAPQRTAVDNCTNVNNESDCNNAAQRTYICPDNNNKTLYNLNCMWGQDGCQIHPMQTGPCMLM